MMSRISDKHVKFRDHRDADINLVLNSWLKTLHKSIGRAFHKNIPPGIYFPQMQEKIKAIIARSSLLIASNPNDEDHVFGWICYERPAVVHYIYVKQPYRRFGLAQAIFNKAEIAKPVIITAIPTNKLWPHVKRINIDECIYNPFLAE